MNTSTLDVHLAQVPTITMPQNSMIGTSLSATFGVCLLMVAYFSITMEAGKARVYLGEKVHTWAGDKFDWKSALYWFLGILGTTAILGSSAGVTKEYFVWAQENVVGTDLLDFLGDFVKLVLCVFLIWMAAKKREKEPIKGDVIWGTICAVVLPILADFGAIGSCIVMVYMAMKSKGDSKADLYWGVCCGLLFPLGGGWAVWVSTQISYIVAEVVTWGNA